MKLEAKPPALDANADIPALIETLLATEQRLEELTGGQVDTVEGSDGRMFLLRRAQEQLRFSEAARQAAILDALPAHIALVDSQGTIISVNEAWRRFAIANVFHAPGHGVGLNYLEACERARGDFSAEARQVAAGIRAVLSGGQESFSIEYPCHSLKEQRWFLLTVTPLAKDRQNGAVVMHLNITGRRQAETAAIRLAAIVESSGDAIIGKDLKGMITSWNQGAEEIFGYAAAEMVGTSIRRLLPAGQPDDYQPILARIKRGENVEHFETVRQTKAGMLVDISVTTSPIRDATSKVIGVSMVARDITERMRTESTLRTSQANMAAAQRLAHLGSWELELTHSKDVDANALRWSDEMFRIAGYEPGAVAVSNELFFRLIPPEDREPIRQAVATAIRERREYSIVHRLIRPDGGTRVVQETAQILFDETTGQAVKIVGTAHDITEQRKAEEALRESEERFSGAFEFAPIGVTLVSLDDRLFKVNRACCDLLGYSEAELLARTFHEITHAVDHETSRENVRRLRAGEIRSFEMEKGYVHRQGHIITALTTVSIARGHEGLPLYLIAQIQDITERKRSEQVIARGLQRLNEAQRIGQIGDWEWDLATQAITWSPQVFEILGRDPRLGPPCNYEGNAALYDAASQALMKEKVTLAINSGEAQDYELRAYRPNGTIVDVLGRAVPRKNESGKVVGLVGTVQDITARKRSKAALQESEARYHSLFENMVEGYAYCRTRFEQDQLRDFTYVEVNSAFDQLTGLKAVVGKKISEVIPGVSKTSPQLFEVLNRVALTGKTEKFETYLKPLGIWFSITAYSQEREHFVAVFDNITERKQAEAALRASEAEFRALAEAMPQMVWITRADGWNIYFSQQWMDYTGLTLEESLGHGWNKPFHPEDQQRAWDAWQHAVATTGTYSVESRLRRADGVYRWWLIRGVPHLDNAGNILKWFGTCTDIHDLKLAEETLRLLGSAVEQAKESIVITDADLELPGPRIVFVNPAFTTMTGYSAEEAIGKTPRMFQGPRTDRTVLNRLRHNLERGEAFHGEVINYRKDATEYDLEWQVAPIRNVGGTITHFVAIQRDITERKRAEAELEQAHQEVVKASRQAGMAEVATGILHNVGNVLNSVTVASSCVADSIRKSKAASLGKVVGLLREHEADLGDFLTVSPQGKQIPGYLAQLAEHLVGEQTAALKELAHLQKNIEHIKDIIAMQQGFAKVSGTTELLSVADLVEDALKMNASALVRHDIEVHREFQEIPLLPVEKHQVLQILVNLVRNAMQACDEANPLAKQITLRVTRGDEGVRIAVTDNGIGIPAENLTRIFAHGFTTKPSGHGFGLHSAALAAKKMGGALTVQSDGRGQGATFTLKLPYSTREKTHE